MDRVQITDVTDPANVIAIADAFYPSPGYTHQGWLTEDERHILVNDEGDEGFGQATRTMVIDVQDLDSPEFDFIYSHDTNTVDHNLYIHDGHAYEANYNHGLRILDLADIDSDRLSLVAQFDTFPSSPDGAIDGFDGAWSVYPYFESGTLIVSDQAYGLFVLRATGLNTVTAPEASGGSLRLSAPSPNPASGETALHLTAPKAGAQGRVVLFDARGRAVRTLHSGPLAREMDVRVDTSDLPAGAYVVWATSGVETVSVSLVVTR